MTNTMRDLSKKAPTDKLTVDELACALYEGTPHLQNLAEKLARQHGHAQALTFFDMQGELVRGFWRHIAQQLRDHALEWETNEGSACVLSHKETARLYELVRPTAVQERAELARSEAGVIVRALDAVDRGELTAGLRQAVADYRAASAELDDALGGNVQ